MNQIEFLSLDDALNFISPGDTLISKNQSGSGGCINSTYLLRLKSGKSLFIKENSHAPKDMFPEEATGLKALLNKYPQKVPQPLAWGREGQRDFLILEYIKNGSPNNTFWSDFARSMVTMHKKGDSETFGFTSDNYIGSTRQINEMMSCWTDFFCEKRLHYQLELAGRKNLADRFMIDGVESICSRITTLLPEPEFPSLLHGDLWSGNFMVDESGHAVLIDPAVYYGHREADLAMTELFGGFNRSFYRTYNEAFPLEKGYESRKDLYNLYHMLNHLNLFGSSYSGSVRSIISAYL